MSYKAKPNELNKKGDMRGKRGKDKKPRQMYVPQYSEEQIAYWYDMLNVVEEFLNEYLASEKVQEFVNSKWKTSNGSRPPRFTPQELAKRGLEYFRFTLERKRNMAIYGLALFLGVDTIYIMRMEQKQYEQGYYKNDIYKPIIRTFKNLVGLFHEDLGTNKINPNFHIFVLKALRSGFEEVLDLNMKDPEGLSETEREDLRKKISTFTEVYTKKKPN